MTASFARTTSAKPTVEGSGARSSAKSERWSRAQIRKKPSSLVTRVSPRSLPGSVVRSGVVIGVLSDTGRCAAGVERAGEQQPAHERVTEADGGRGVAE